MNQKLLAMYGLKWNPFTPEVPTEALYVPPKVENFCWRIEQAHLREGGFALIHGDPGSRQKRRHAPARRASRALGGSVGRRHPPSAEQLERLLSRTRRYLQPSPSASATAGAASRRCAPAGSIILAPPAADPSSWSTRHRR